MTKKKSANSAPASLPTHVHGHLLLTVRVQCSMHALFDTTTITALPLCSVSNSECSYMYAHTNFMKLAYHMKARSLPVKARKDICRWDFRSVSSSSALRILVIS